MLFEEAEQIGLFSARADPSYIAPATCRAASGAINSVPWPRKRLPRHMIVADFDDEFTGLSGCQSGCWDFD